MAIAFDASASATTNASGSGFGYSHTCGAGTGRVLVVGIAYGTSGVDEVTSVTYNSVTMTRLIGAAWNSGNKYYTFYYLFNPSTGANTVQITTSSSRQYVVVSSSYSGCSAIDNSAGVTTGTAATATGSLTTVANNCWTILVNAKTDTGAEAQTAGTATTLRVDKQSSGTLGIAYFDSNAVKTPAGSVSLVANWVTSGDFAYEIISLSPSTNNTVALAQGAYALTGFTLGIFVQHILALAQGAYALTGQAISFMMSRRWNDESRSSTTFTNDTKH